MTFSQQGDRSVWEFATLLRSLWRQQDAVTPVESSGCVICQALVRAREALRTFAFVMRLQPAFEPIRGQIVNRDPVPSFDTVVALVIAEETRMRSSTTMSVVPLTATPGVVLAAHQPSLAPRFTSPSTRVPPAPSAPTDASSAFCRYCKKRGHLRDQCPKLLRRQQNQGQQRSPAPAHPLQAAIVESSTSEPSTSFATRMDQLTEQLQVLQRAFQAGSPSAMSAASGILSSWILDSGATHHMTSDATQLVDLRPSHLTS